jgi:hypothetical protein
VQLCSRPGIVRSSDGLVDLCHNAISTELTKQNKEKGFQQKAAAATLPYKQQRVA